jgi:hypothetical protein
MTLFDLFRTFFITALAGIVALWGVPRMRTAIMKFGEEGKRRL